MKNTVPVNTSALPSTRRTFLGGIAALPVLAGPAALAASANPDADLIAFAAKVEALGVQSNAAMTVFCDLDNLSDKHEAPGLLAAEVVYDEARARFCDAFEELTPMEPTTVAGLAAKARVAVLLDPYDDLHLDDDEKALWASILRAVIKIGGAA